MGPESQSSALDPADSRVARTRTWDGIPEWVRKGGLFGWLVAGMVGAFALALYLVQLTASISYPLIIAVVIGVVAYPIVDALEKWHIPRAIGAVLVLALLIAAIGVTAWVTVSGVIQQWPAIQTQITNGVDALKDALAQYGFDNAAIKQAVDDVAKSAAKDTGGLLSGLTGFLASGLSGAITLLMGLFISAFLLYYVLSDFRTISWFVSRHLMLPPDLGMGVLEDATGSLRGYFVGTTVSGLIVALVIGIGVWVLQVPLAFPIALVTFLTCYIPFFGAFISGAFAFLIALGAGGLTSALLVLAVVLIAQNLIQTVVNAKALGTSLDLNPLVVLVMTMFGGIVAGLLGAALAAPFTAMIVKAQQRIRRARPGGSKTTAGVPRTSVARAAPSPSAAPDSS